MTADEFIELDGPPKPAIPVPAHYAMAYADRLPSEILSFWNKLGWGGYADMRYWICDPGPFEPLIDALCRSIPALGQADLVVYGYSCLGMVDIWHRSGRRLTYDLSTGLLMDLECRLNEAGEHPPGHLGGDIFRAIATATDRSGYDLITNDDDEPLIPLLRATYGLALYGEVYVRDLKIFETDVRAYERLTLARAFERMPAEIKYVRYDRLKGENVTIARRVS